MIRVSRDDGDRNAGDWWDLVEAACLPGRVCIFTRAGLDAERFTAKVAAGKPEPEGFPPCG